MKRSRPRFKIATLAGVVGIAAYLLATVQEFRTATRADARFVAWVHRSIEPKGSPWLHIYAPPTPPILFILGCKGYIELVSPTGRTIVVRARFGPGDRIARVTAAAAGREVEFPRGDPDAGRPFDFQAALPEAFRQGFGGSIDYHPGHLGLPTGRSMPQGFETEAGPPPRLDFPASTGTDPA